MSKTYLELVDDKSSKFWEIEVNDNTYIVRYGKIGANGRTSSKTFDSADEAQKQANKVIASKRKKGYTEPQTAGELVALDLPEPAALRGGWAALAAVCASRGWTDSAHASDNRWFYHDGGGNWACLHVLSPERAVLFGHDHEYSETYFADAAEYFGEEETDLLAGAPQWWRECLALPPNTMWIGFVYGWDGEQWQRAEYDLDDGFESLNLLGACSINSTELLEGFAADAPGLNGNRIASEHLQALILADAQITPELLEAVVPGWDIAAGVEASRAFLHLNV